MSIQCRHVVPFTTHISRKIISITCNKSMICNTKRTIIFCQKKKLFAKNIDKRLERKKKMLDKARKSSSIKTKLYQG